MEGFSDTMARYGKIRLVSVTQLGPADAAVSSSAEAAAGASAGASAGADDELHLVGQV
ncbi:MAG: hypothetical protein LBT14_02850 [Treponema sp.]|nr:hypothetical protein [Treponema sp.]